MTTQDKVILTLDAAFIGLLVHLGMLGNAAFLFVIVLVLITCAIIDAIKQDRQ